jgi:hypothetical protein
MEIFQKPKKKNPKSEKLLVSRTSDKRYLACVWS